MGQRRNARSEPPRAWQRMLSGRRLDLLDPSPLDVEIEDIAHGLARVGRWNGQTQGAHIFSVAQHSVLVEAVAVLQNADLSADVRLTILLHDAAEYVIGDMISPFKAVLGDAYKGVEARILTATLIRFGLPPKIAPEVVTLIKEADRIAAHEEAVRLAGFQPEEARKFFGQPARLPSSIAALLSPWPATEAQSRFLQRFHSLTAHMQKGP